MLGQGRDHEYTSQCTDGCRALDQLRGEMKEELATIQASLSTATAGVSNFRTFQLEMKGKVGFVHGAVWAWSLIALVLIGIFAWEFRQAYPAVRQIMIEYYEHHPDAQINAPNQSKGSIILASFPMKYGNK
jgi:hypothetical protein